MNNLDSKLSKKALLVPLSFNWDRRMSYEKIRLFDYAIQFDLSKLTNVDLGIQAYRIKNGIMSSWYQKENFNEFMDKLIKFFKDPDSVTEIKKLIKYIKTYLKKSEQISNKYEDYSKMSDKMLLSHYLDFCKLENKLSFMNHLLFMHFEKALTTALQELLPDKKHLEILTLQTRMLPIEEYNKDICRHIQNKISFEDIYKKYRHMGMQDVFDKPLSKETLKKDIDALKEKNIDKILRDLKKKYMEQKYKVDKILSTWKKDEQIYTLLTYFSLYGNEKDWKNFLREKTNYKLSILLNEMSKRRSLSVEDISYLTIDEKKKLMARELKDMKEIKKRKGNCIYLIYKNDVEVITDKNYIALFDDKTKNSLSIIKGKSAYKGKVKGRACILLSKQDFNKFNQGDIIVAPTTRPDFIPLMKKARAFVTNEGGLLSHAAIVSRELKKPCIIGTINATKIINDGDILEVDADNGIIKLLR